MDFRGKRTYEVFVFPRCHENQNCVPSQEGAETCILCLLAQLSLASDQTPSRKLPTHGDAYIKMPLLWARIMQAKCKRIKQAKCKWLGSE